MHRSRLHAIVVDCDDIEAGVRFWTQALGVEATRKIEPYTILESLPGDLHFLLQQVDEPKTAKSRIHVDIESDDVGAEVARLESLGGRRVEAVEDWWIMNDPCGNEFCVVPANADELVQRSANVWNP